ncbi:MAG: alcohol dehydrogenase (cytochrome c) [Gammaproteobacteria bacterium]|jgi:alcohol dehydrogenase (cytochrome c)
MIILKLITSILLSLLTLSAVAESSSPSIDANRLLAAENDPDNWLSFGRGYTNQNFSPLKKINTNTVKRLVPKWIFQTGKKGSFQTQPLVADGVMYATIPGNDVVALDAEKGTVLWRYKHKNRKEKNKAGPANRGAALGYGKVFEATNDGRLIALDQTTGEIVWDKIIARPTDAELEGLTQTQKDFLKENSDSLPAKMAPVVYRDLVVVGVTAAGYGMFYNIFSRFALKGTSPDEIPPADRFLGLRGYVAAFNVNTGEEVWRWYTTKSEGWEGKFATTTPDGDTLPRDIALEKKLAPTLKDRWRIGGTSTWMTPSFDPKQGLIFVGTGNASPNDVSSARPGDNLYANSLVAIDAYTGETRWHYQHVPHDLWGYDLASTSVLFDLPDGDNIIPAIGIASKTGWFYVHNRETGKLIYRSEAFVPQNNLYKAPSDEGVVSYPGSWGGASWSPTSYNATTGTAFIAGIHKPTLYRTEHTTFEGKEVPYILTEIAKGEPSWGTLTALDIHNQGRIKWQVKTDLPLIGGTLATAGNLVFMGEGSGMFAAFDSKSGQRLWEFNCGAGVNAPPMSYMIGDQQYIAVAAGGHGLLKTPSGDALIGFGLAD